MDFLDERLVEFVHSYYLKLEYDDNLNELINMVKRSPESAADAGIQSDRNAFEATLESKGN